MIINTAGSSLISGFYDRGSFGGKETNMSFHYNCAGCETPCDGISKSAYHFENDVQYSERKEKYVIDRINKMTGYHAEKCELPGYPDIVVQHGDDTFYIEIKAQRRTFMAVQRLLPYARLIPSETLALNLSDLQRYFAIEQDQGSKIYLMWCLENRPCIVKSGETRYFYQSAKRLKEIYTVYRDNRRFRRQSGDGDVVNGQHKGVVVNYHFSLDELTEASDNNNFAEILNDESRS